MKIILIILLLITALSQLTFNLNTHRFKTVIQPSRNFYKHHLKHYKQTHHLQSRLTFFTIQMNVSGLYYPLTLDTGSAEFFIKGVGTQGHPQKKFNCSQCIKKYPHQPTGYLDGTLQTYRINLPIELGSHKFNETILVAYQTDSKNFIEMGGLIGLSFQQLSSNPTPNFINTLINNKIIDKYIFGMQLDLYSNTTSFITFGEPDYRFIQQNKKISYFNLIANTISYRAQISGFIVGNNKLTAQSALFDTGNTCISIPQIYANQILKQFNSKDNSCQFIIQKSNSMFSQLSCNITNFDILPKIGFYRDQQKFEVQKDGYIDNCKQIQKNKYTCGLLIQTMVGRSKSLIIGTTIFMRYYVVFDLQNKKIGLARNKNKATIEQILKRKYTPINQ